MRHGWRRSKSSPPLATIAATGLPVRISAHLACAENMRNRPTAPATSSPCETGSTVEARTPTPKGRLVMPDAIALALSRNLMPSSTGHPHRHRWSHWAHTSPPSWPARRPRSADPRRRGQRWRALLADAAAGRAAGEPEVPRRRSEEHRRADGRHAGGRAVPAGLVPERAAGALGHRRSCLNDSAPPRLHTSGGTGFAARTLIGLARG